MPRSIALLAMKRISAEIFRRHVAYDPITGIFIRITSAHGAGIGRDAEGYVRFMVAGCSARGQVWAWLTMTGEWPTDEMDHINGDRSDNRWGNLRHVTHAVNMQNKRKPYRNNSCGYLGVRRERRRFVAQVGLVRVGLFDTPEEAHAAYLEAKRRLHIGCTI